MFRPYIPSTSIWRRITPLHIPSSQLIFSKRFSKIKICPQPSNYQEEVKLNNSESKNKRRRGRRRIKANVEYELALHTKDNDDNIKRKVKTHFHNFIVAYLNMLIRHNLKTKRVYKFKKMDLRGESEDSFLWP